YRAHRRCDITACRDATPLACSRRATARRHGCAGKCRLYVHAARAKRRPGGSSTVRMINMDASTTKLSDPTPRTPRSGLLLQRRQMVCQEVDVPATSNTPDERTPVYQSVERSRGSTGPTEELSAPAPHSVHSIRYSCRPSCT